jgi:hypothetical protein
VIFIWDDWNINHIGKHHVTPLEAEEVVKSAQSPFPRKADDEK